MTAEKITAVELARLLAQAQRECDYAWQQVLERDEKIERMEAIRVRAELASPTLAEVDKIIEDMGATFYRHGIHVKTFTAEKLLLLCRIYPDCVLWAGEFAEAVAPQGFILATERDAKLWMKELGIKEELC